MLTRYNKVIYCQFCKNYYYQKVFRQHLQFCSNYINYLHNYKNRITWKPRYEKRVSYTKNPQAFSNLVENKRVIIVGPSATVQNCNLGTFINNFDVVIRLNKSLPIPTKMYPHIGFRTDVLYNSLNTSDYPGENKFHPLFLRKQKVRYLRCPYPPISPFTNDIKSFYRKNKNMVDFGHIDTTYYTKLEHSIGTRPYTGTCAIADLLHCGVGELYVMGLDFYTYKHAHYYRNVSERKLKKLRNNNIHRRKPQIDLIRRFYLLDDRLVVDNVLDEILLENYDNLFYGLQSNIHIGKVFISGTGEFLDNIFGKKICIVGDKGREEETDYKNTYTIIDLCPERDFPIQNKNTYLIYRDKNQVEEDTGENIIFTQVYKKDMEEKFKKSNYIFINPLFTQYLKTILLKTIFSKGTLTLELFMILIFSIFYDDVKISNVDPHYNWQNQAYDEKQHYIEQRMLFKYLLKRNKIRTL